MAVTDGWFQACKRYRLRKRKCDTGKPCTGCLKDCHYEKDQFSNEPMPTQDGFRFRGGTFDWCQSARGWSWDL